MVLPSFSDEFKRESKKGSIKLEAVARINLPPRVYLDVVDYVAAENGSLTFTFTKRVKETIEERFEQGVDYSGVSPDATALSISNRINATGSLVDLTATPVGNSVQVVAVDPTSRIVIRHVGATSDKDAAILITAADDQNITLIVDDNGDTSGGELIVTAYRDGGKTSAINLVEGASYDADLSNETTASRIVTAIHAASGLSPLRAKQIKGSNRIQVTGGGSITSLSIVHQGDPTPTNDGAIASVIPDAATQAHFQTGDKPLAILRTEQAAFFGLSEMQSIGYSIDAKTREYTTDEVELTFLDDNDAGIAGIRKIASEYPLIGRTVDLYIGTDDINVLGNWFQLPSMIITEVLPRPGAIVFRLEDFSALWRDQQIVGEWLQEHPVDVLYDVIKNRTRLVDDAVHIDATTFDPSLAALANIGHFVVTRLNERTNPAVSDPPIEEAVDEAISAGDLVKELLLITGGIIRPNNSGAFRYHHYDQSAVADRTWAAGPLDGHDVDELDQVEGAGSEIINAVKVEFAENRSHVSLENADSIDQIARRFDYSIETPWNNALARLSLINTRNTGGSPDDFEIDAASFRHQAARGHTGFAGHAWEADSAGVLTKPAHAELANVSGSNRAFIRIEAINGVGRFDSVSLKPEEGAHAGEPEYIAVNDLTLDGIGSRRLTYDAVSGVTKSKLVATEARYHIDTSYNDADLGFVNGRAGLGSTSPSQWGSPLLGDFATGNPRVLDVTIPIQIIQRTIARYRFGAPVVRCRTRFDQADLEVGDFISFSGDDIFLGFSKSGADTNVIFEITRKTLLPFDDFPSVEWELTFVRDDSQPAEVATPSWNFDPPATSTVVPPVVREPYFDQTGASYIADDGGGIYYPDS